jgi:hypothetical protein
VNNLYSASNNTFYPSDGLSQYEIAGTLPDDLVEVTNEEFAEFSKFTNGDLVRVPGRNGLPEWGVRPPLTPDDVTILKNALMSDAGEKMQLLRDAVDTDMATDEEKLLLNDWKKYRVLLSRIDAASAPDIDWPVQPSRRQ